MIKLSGVAVCVLFCCVLVRDKNRAVASVLSVAGVIILLIGAAGELGRLISGLSELSDYYTGSREYIKLMVKVLGITLLSGLIGDICRDNGETALASAAETGAKVIVAVMLLPLFETVIEIVTGLVK